MKASKADPFQNIVLAALMITTLAGCNTELEDVVIWKAKGKTNKLIIALEHTDANIRDEAAKSLGELKTSAAADPLAKLIHDPELHIALSAVTSLVSINNEPARHHLMGALKHKSARVRKIAASSMGTLNVRSSVGGLTTALDDGFDEVAVAAATSLGQLDDENAIGPLVAKLQNRSQALRLACVNSIGNIGGEKATAAIASALDDISKEVRQASIDELIAIGQPALPYALETLQHESPLARRSALAVLRGINIVPSTGRDLIWFCLAQATIDDNLEVDQAVVQTLSNQEEATIEMLKAVAHPSEEIRAYGARTLETIGESCVEQAVAAAKAVDSIAKPWFESRLNWSGAPSWHIDLWAATIVLNPSFVYHADKAEVLLSDDKRARKILSSKNFIPTHEYIPLFIQQLGYQSPKKNIDSDHYTIVKKQLLATGSVATFPLIAALEGDNERISGRAAEILAELNEERALESLIQVVTKKIEAGEYLYNSYYYNALLKFDSPATESLLKNIRPNSIQAKRLFSQKYPKTKLMDIQAFNEYANKPNQPIGFRFIYQHEEDYSEMCVTFKKTLAGNWIPEPIWPENLP